MTPNNKTNKKFSQDKQKFRFKSHTREFPPKNGCDCAQNYKLLILVLVQGFSSTKPKGAVLASWSNCALCSIFWPLPLTAAGVVATTLLLLLLLPLLLRMLLLSLQWPLPHPGLIHLLMNEHLKMAHPSYALEMVFPVMKLFLRHFLLNNLHIV